MGVKKEIKSQKSLLEWIRDLMRQKYMCQSKKIKKLKGQEIVVKDFDIDILVKLLQKNYYKSYSDNFYKDMCLDFYKLLAPPSLSQISPKTLFVTSLQNVMLKFTVSEVERLKGWLKRCEGEELQVLVVDPCQGFPQITGRLRDYQFSEYPWNVNQYQNGFSNPCQISLNLICFRRDLNPHTHLIAYVFPSQKKIKPT